MAPQTPYGASWRHFLALMAKKGDAPFFIWQKQEMAPYGVKRRNGAMWRNRHIWRHAAPYDACAIFYGAIFAIGINIYCTIYYITLFYTNIPKDN